MKALYPFIFKGCYFLLESVDLVAYDVAQLLEILHHVPESSIYLHTYGSYLRHQFFPPPYPNDFASWAALQLRDRVLAEKIGILDPLHYEDLNALRKALIDILYRHLRTLKQVPSVGAGDPFYFFAVDKIVVELPLQASSLAEFSRCLKQVHISSIYYHTFDAMFRKKVGGGTFALWIKEALNLPHLASRIQHLPFHLFTLEDLRKQLLLLIKEHSRA